MHAKITEFEECLETAYKLVLSHDDDILKLQTGPVSLLQIHLFECNTEISHVVVVTIHSYLSNHQFDAKIWKDICNCLAISVHRNACEAPKIECAAMYGVFHGIKSVVCPLLWLNNGFFFNNNLINDWWNLIND